MREIECIILRDDPTVGGTHPTASLCFPATRYQLADALERARVHEAHPGFTCMHYHCAIPGLSELLPEKVFLEGLNLLAYRLSELSDRDRMAYEAMLKIDTHEKTIGNLINLTYHLTGCQCADIKNDSQLGQFLIENGLAEGQENIPEPVLAWLDFEKVGAAHRKAENGVFVRGGYVVDDRSSWNPVYPQELLPKQIPEQDAPIQGVFRLYATFRENPEETGVWMELPMDRDKVRMLLHVATLEDCIFTEAVSSIAPLTTMLAIYEDFDYLNEIAGVFAEVAEKDQIKLKAALHYENCTDLSKAASLSQRLDAYELLTDLESSEDYGRWLLCHQAVLNFEASELLSCERYGKEMMRRHQAGCTPYGILRPRVI